MKKIENVNVKKLLAEGAFVLAIGGALGSVGIVTSMIKDAKENVRKETAIDSAYGVVAAAEYEYVESLLGEETKTYGNAKDLEVNGTKPTSGTWLATDINNDGEPEIILDDVVIGNYICNTDIETQEIKAKLR